MHIRAKRFQLRDENCEAVPVYLCVLQIHPGVYCAQEEQTQRSVSVWLHGCEKTPGGTKGRSLWESRCRCRFHCPQLSAHVFGDACTWRTGLRLPRRCRSHSELAVTMTLAGVTKGEYMRIKLIKSDVPDLQHGSVSGQYAAWGLEAAGRVSTITQSNEVMVRGNL